MGGDRLKCEEEAIKDEDGDARVNNGELLEEMEKLLENKSENEPLDEGGNSESSVTERQECLECGFIFSTVDNLSIHMLNIHSKAQPRGVERLKFSKYRRMRDQNNECVKRYRQNRERMQVTFMHSEFEPS